MQDPVVVAFFDERKAAWLKKNLNASMSEVEINEKELECEEVFALNNWLPKAAKRAKSRKFSSHPSKFSHPSTGVGEKNKKNFTYVTPTISYGEKNNDGFLRTGNVNLSLELDSIGDAAVLDVNSFLTLKLGDGQTLLQHIEQDSPQATELLSLPNAAEGESYQDLKEGFLAMAAADDNVITSSKIKQVFFPVSQNQELTEYHLLSTLTPSGIVFEMRKRLDAMRFGDENKEAREKRKNGQQHSDYREIYDLTTIGYGGTKPQNISVLNNQNGGKAHLLLSVPPVIKKRDIYFPNTDFFAQSVNYFQCQPQFYALHKLYKLPNEIYNNMQIRNDRDEIYQNIIDSIIERMWQVRSVAAEQYMETTNQLAKAQTTWLCEESRKLRMTTDDWLDEIISSITLFMFHGYEKRLGKKAIKLGEAERQQMAAIAELNKEMLR